MHGRKLGTLAVAALLGVSMVLFLGQGTATAALSKQDQQCLACHSAEGLEKKLANGETLSLHVPGQAFAKSVHSKIGCVVCHSGTTLENHPPLKSKIASVRENSIELAKGCHSCHGEISKQYEGSIHATLVREGNPVAPICTDCHSPHAVMSKAAYDAATGAPCSKCHDPVFKVFSGSVHGKVGLGCSNCHSAHDVIAATAGDQVKNACLGCHPNTLAEHHVWLPNTERHLDAVSCPACHAPGAKRRVNLRLYDSTAQELVSEKQGVPQFESRARFADTKGKGLDALALQSLLREFNRDGENSKTTLRGRLELSDGIAVHQLADKSKAIRNCDSCHRQGADPFQSVTVSIVGPDGRPLRYDAH